MRKVGAAALFFFGALAIAVGAASRVLAVVFDEIREGLGQGAAALYKQAEVLEREPAAEPGAGLAVVPRGSSVDRIRFAAESEGRL